MNTESDEQSRLSESLAQSPRFAVPKSRRDFLGLAATWSALCTLLVAAIGALRLPMPAVFPESNSKVKLGPPARFAVDTATHLPELSVWLFREADGGMYAISAVCTHLGCIVKREAAGDFLCPCHGSRFSAEGRVVAGPAPSGLEYLSLTLAPDGQIVVDTRRKASSETRLMI